MRQIVTDEMAKFINLARTDQRISLHTLATCMGKSPAFLSNIENGKIKTVSGLDLEKILDCIIGTEESLIFFLNSGTETIKYLNENRVNDKLISIFDYDLNTRKIHIPKELVEYINVALKMIKSSRELLYMEFEEFQEPPKGWELGKIPPINKAFCFEDMLSVRVKLEFEQVIEILDAKTEKTSYAVMAALLLALRLIMAKNAGLVEEENKQKLADELVESVHATLFDFGFFSLTQISIRMELTKDTIEQKSDMVSDQYIDSLLRQINYYLRIHIKSSDEDRIKDLERIVSSLQWDTSFWLKVASMAFFNLDNSSFTHKKRFLNELNDTLDDYINTPNEIKTRDFF